MRTLIVDDPTRYDRAEFWLKHHGYQYERDGDTIRVRECDALDVCADLACSGGGVPGGGSTGDESMTRNGDWMLTASGRQFWPLDPRPEEIHIEDIAHALAHQCRFGGHCRLPDAGGAV